MQNPPPPRGIWLVSQVKSYLEKEKAKKASEQPSDRWARVTANATKRIAWLTLGLALAGGANIWLLEEQLTDERKSIVAQTRAWMIVSATGFSIGPDSRSIPRARGVVTIQNTGPTPALNVQLWRCAEVRSAEPKVTDTPDAGAKCLETGVGIAGNAVPIPMLLYDETFAVPPGGLPIGKQFYYWGRVTYNLEPDGSRHSTTFCLKNAADQLGPCNEGNEAD